MRNAGTSLGLNLGNASQDASQLLLPDPYMAFNFIIEIDGLLVGGFSELTGLESQLQTEEYNEGGVNHFVHKLPGPTTYPNLVLSRGMTLNNLLWLWYYEITQGIIQRKNGSILLLNQRHIPVVWWNVRNAYPVRWSGPTLNAATDAIAIESLELAHEGLSRPLF